VVFLLAWRAAAFDQIEEGALMGTTQILCSLCESPFVIQVEPATLSDRLASLFSYRPFQCESCIKQDGRRSSSGPAERRKSVRVPVQIPVTFESNEFSGEGTLTDMSMHGCSLISQQTLRTGIVIRLNLPAGPGQKPSNAKQQLATVVVVTGNRAGLKFLAYSSQEKDVLAQTVTRSVKIFASR
jgi:hypothetical protein